MCDFKVYSNQGNTHCKIMSQVIKCIKFQYSKHLFNNIKHHVHICNRWQTDAIFHSCHLIPKATDGIQRQKKKTITSHQSIDNAPSMSWLGISQGTSLCPPPPRRPRQTPMVPACQTTEECHQHIKIAVRLLSALTFSFMWMSMTWYWRLCMVFYAQYRIWSLNGLL